MTPASAANVRLLETLPSSSVRTHYAKPQAGPRRMGGRELANMEQSRRNTIRRLYAAGKKQKEIAFALGVSETAISRAVRILGLK